ncbi:MAG: hypothetical protein ACRCYU_19495 [Nocardioides sp.]
MSTLTLQAAPAFGVRIFDFHQGLADDLRSVTRCFDEFVGIGHEVAVTSPPGAGWVGAFGDTACGVPGRAPRRRARAGRR